MRTVRSTLRIGELLDRRFALPTLDIDLAVTSYGDVPRSLLEREGFSMAGRFAPSESWKGPDGTPVHSTDDRMLLEAIRQAELRTVDGVPLRVATVLHLVRAKLRACDDPARRRSKRLMDIADAVALAERHPEVLTRLTPDERRRVQAE